MNPYLKIAAAAVIASYISPKIANRFTREELNEMDGYINTAVFIGSHAGVAVGVYALANAILGGPKATTTGSGGAS